MLMKFYVQPIAQAHIEAGYILTTGKDIDYNKDNRNTREEEWISYLGECCNIVVEPDERPGYSSCLKRMLP